MNKDSLIVVCCSAGYRSRDIADKFHKKGFNIRNLYGGILEWINQGNHVFDELGQNGFLRVRKFIKNLGLSVY